MTQGPHELTANVLFADVVGSTERLRSQGEESGVLALQEEHARLSGLVESYRGSHLKWLGDGVLAVFRSAADAARCAIDIQRTARLSPPDLQAEWRVGINVGEVEERAGEYFGTPIVIAQRLCAQALPGSIYCSTLFRQLLSGREAFDFREVGERRLKGIEFPVHISELVAPTTIDRSLLSRIPLIGRDTELSVLRDSVDRLAAGKGGFLLLQGGIGAGKSRLLDEAVRMVQGIGGRVLRGTGRGGEVRGPYAPITQALQSAVAEDSIDQITDETAKLRLALMTLSGESDGHNDGRERDAPDIRRRRLFDVVAAAFEQMSRDRPLLFAFDDAHLADSDTADLFGSIAVAVADKAILVAASSEHVSGPPPPLKAKLAELQGRLPIRIVDVSPLAERETKAFLRRVSGLQLSPGRVEGIWRACGGNPLLLHELLLDVMTRPADAEPPQLLEVQPKVPSSIALAVRARAGQLGDNARALLRVGALFAGPFPLEAAAWVAQLSEDEALDAIDEALEAEIVRPVGVLDQYAFAQSIVQRVLVDDLSPSRRARLHQRAAEAVELIFPGAVNQFSSDLAHLYGEARQLSANNALKAVEYATTAAERAERATAWSEAWRNYAFALDCVSDAPNMSIETAALLRAGLARCQRSAGAWAESKQNLDIALAMFRDAGMPEEFGRAVLDANTATMSRSALANLADEAIAFLHEDGDPHLAGKLYALRALVQDDDGGRQAAAHARDLTTRHSMPDVTAELSRAEFREAMQDMRLDDAIAIRRRAFSYFEEHGPLQNAGAALVSVLTCTSLLGDVDACLAAAQDLSDFGRRTGLTINSMYALTYRAAIALLQCDYREFRGLTEHLAADLFSTRLLRMSHAEAMGNLQAADELAPDLNGVGQVEYWVPQVQAAIARVKFNSGDIEGAAAELDRWEQSMTNCPLVQNRAIAIAELDECLPMLGRDELVNAVFEEISAWRLVHLGGSSARGLDRQRGALALRLGNPGEAEYWFRAGISWAETARAPVELGRCQASLANLLRDSSPAEAVELRGEARSQFERHQARLYLRRLGDLPR